MAEFNKNDKQLHFNNVKGMISELNDGKDYCSVTLDVGKQNKRMINVSMKKEKFDEVIRNFNMGDKVLVYFFAVSRKKFDRYYTTLNLLGIEMNVY